MANQKQKRRTDYTGVIIGVILSPILVFFVHQGNEGLGRSVFIALGALMVGIRVRWDLRRHVWFWAAVVLALLLQIPVLFIQWPAGWVPAVVMLPYALVDCLLFLALVQFLEKRMNRQGSGQQ
jgi:hypothetical protein